MRKTVKISPMKEHRPWGYYENLSESSSHKVKRIVVTEGKRLSYQKHKKRSEHWVIVTGSAIVTLDGNDIKLSSGESIDIPKGASHRIANETGSPLVFIEVQMGEYFGEDDIIRMEDDFGRA